MPNGDLHSRFRSVCRNTAIILFIIGGLYASGHLAPSALAEPSPQPVTQTGGLVPEPGFPLTVTGSVSLQSPAGPYINVLAANIDADPRLELVNAIPLGGPLGAWNHDATPVEGWPISGSPAAYGLSSAGQLDPIYPGLEIVTIYSLSTMSNHYLYAYSGHGDVLAGFPITLTSQITSAPVLFDFDQDGLDEIVIATSNGRLYAYRSNGALLAGWPLAVSGVNTGTPVIVDLNQDGAFEIVVTTTDSTDIGHVYLYALHLNGSVLPGFPVSFHYDTQGASRFPVVGDVDGDSAPEIVLAACSYSWYPVVQVYGSDATLEHELSSGGSQAVCSASAPALGDLDGDNVPEIISQSTTQINAWRGDGTPFPGFPSSYRGGRLANGGPVIGDITGDNKPEIVVFVQLTSPSSEYGRLFVFDRDGALLDDVGLLSGHGGVPAIADIDLDGRNEVVALADGGSASTVTDRPIYYAYEWADSGPSGPLQWAQFNNGPRHNGVYAPLASRYVDLALSMTDDPDPIPADGTTTYHLTITNRGSRAATHVILNNTLPPDTDLIAVSGADNCTEDSGVLRCDLGTFINGEKRIVSLEIRARHAGTLTNYASIRATEAEATLSNNLASATTTVLPGADLWTSVTADQTKYTAGDTVIYTITLTNDGPDATTGVIVTDSLPAELAFVSSAADRGSYAETTGEWTVGNIAVGESLQLILTAAVPEDGETVLLHNEATVSASDVLDSDTSNQTSYVENQVNVVDLAAGIWVNNEWPLEGEILTYTIAAINGDQGLATDIDIDITLPPGLTLISAEPEQGTFNPVTGRWHLDELLPSSELWELYQEDFLSLTLTVRVDAGTSGQTLTMTSQVAHVAEADSDVENDYDERSVTVNAVDLHINTGVSCLYTSEGKTFSFLVSVTNGGANTAHNVVVQIPLVPEVAYRSSYAPQGTYDAATGNWTVGTLAPSAGVTLNLVVETQPDTFGEKIVQVAYLLAVDELDVVSWNNEDDASVRVVNTDLALEKAASENYPLAGGTFYYALGVSNEGNYVAEDIVVLDQLPDGVTYVSHSTTWGTYDPFTGRWVISGLAADRSAGLTITVKVDDDMTGQLITNSASIIDSNLNDIDPANDTASSTIMAGANNLEVTMTTNRPTPNEGEVVTFYIYLRSHSLRTTTGIRVEDILPDGLTFSSYTASSGTYDDTTGIWSVDSIASHANEMLTLNASVDAGTDQMVLINTAHILSADQPDPKSSDDTASVEVAVGGRNLNLTLSVSDKTVDVGDTPVFTLRLTSNPAAPCTNVIIEDILPPGLDYVSSSATDGSYDPGTGLWTIASYPGAAEATLQIIASVAAGTTGLTITNTAAIISADQYDTYLANNSAQVEIVVGVRDLALSQQVNDWRPGIGDTLTFTVQVWTVENDPASNVVVEDVLPEGITYVSSTATAGTYDETTHLWTIDHVPDIDKATLTITATVDPGTNTLTFYNTATIISADQLDQYPANDSATVTLIIGDTDVSIYKTAQPNTPGAGENTTYTLTLQNRGDSLATSIEVTDILDPRLSFVSATATYGTYDPLTGIWTVDSLPGKTTATLKIEVTVSLDAFGQSIPNTATITHLDNRDSNSSNNTSSYSIQVKTLSVRLLQDAPAAIVYRDSPFEYVYEVYNSGWSDMPATNTAVEIMLPPEVSLQSTATTQGSGCSAVDRIVTCDLGTIDPNTYNYVTLGVELNPGDFETFTTSARVYFDQPERYLDDNSVVSETQVASLTVNTTDDLNDGLCTPSHCSLREALLAANTILGDNTLTFNIPGAAPYTIHPLTALPIITDTVTIDGTSQPGYTDHPLIELDGSVAPVDYGLHAQVGNNTIRALVINNFRYNGIFLETGGYNTITGCYLGLDADGVTDQGNGRHGILATGTGYNQIGGLTADARNVISGNDQYDLYLRSPYNVVQGNFIGLDASGTQRGSNSDSTVNVLQYGILVSAPYNQIGGTEPGARNIISGQKDSGIRITTDTSTPFYTVVQGNYIGTDVTGTHDILDYGSGIIINYATDNIIGGTEPGAGNVISGHARYGIQVNARDTVQGNLIGTDATGTQPLGNANVGIRVESGANLIGGTEPGARNIIAANRGSGIYMCCGRPDKNRIVGNYIGTDITGTLPLGNAHYGIWMISDAYSNTIGGDESGEGNLIAFNQEAGIYTIGSLMQIEGNTFIDNGGLGIDIEPTGANANDAGDGDTGPNDKQNYPILTNVTLNGDTLEIEGTLDSQLNADYRIEFFSSPLCDPSGYGEGKTLLGATTVSITDTTPVSFTATVPAVLTEQAITSTATNLSRATSEFSPCYFLPGADLGITKQVDQPTPNPGDLVTYTLNVVNHGPNDATGVSVEDILPAGLTYQSHTGGTYAPATGEWTIGTLAIGGSRVLSITAQVDSGTAGQTITNTAHISGLDQTDRYPADNSASADISVGYADLDLLSEADVLAANAGDAVQFFTVITNHGPSAAAGIVVSSPLPPEVTYTGELMTQGTYDETTGEWIVGSLAVGAQASLTVSTTINDDTAGLTITKSATITAADQVDSVPDNNTSSRELPIGIADLGLVSAVNNTAPAAEENVEMTVVLTNAGPSKATHVVVHSALPDGIALQDITTTQGSYDATSGQWQVDALSTETTATLTLSGQVNAGSGDSTLTSTSEIASSEQVDPDTTDNTSQVQIEVLPEGDLAISSTPSPDTAGYGDIVTHTVIVTNLGPVNTSDVLVQVILPGELEFVSASPDTGYYDRFIHVWHLNALEVGESATLILQTRVNAVEFGISITTGFTVIHSSPLDTTLANNTATSRIFMPENPPAAPTDLAVSAVDENMVTLGWVDQSSDESAFYVERSLDGINEWVEVGTPAAAVYHDQALTCSTIYYYRVRAFRGTDEQYSSYSNTVSITTTLCAPYLVAPSDGALTNNNAPGLAWNAVRQATMYRVQVDLDPGFGGPVIDAVVNDPLYTPAAPLTDNATYHWRVQALDSGGRPSSWSAVWAFTLDSLRLAAPGLGTPKDHTATKDTTPTFMWKNVKGAVNYQFQLSDDYNFGGTLADITTINRNYTLPAGSELDYGVYYWRVRAQAANGNWSDWSYTNTVTVTILSSPTNAQHLTDTTPTLKWQSAALGALYEVQVDEIGGDFSVPAFTYNGTAKYIAASELPGGDYQWRARADIGSGWSVWTPVWTFTITPPTTTAPGLISPANYATLDTTTPEFTWNPVTNGAIYQIQIGVNNSFKTPVQDVTLDPGVLTYTADELVNGGKYFWRVRAINAEGVAGAWSVKWQFTLNQLVKPVLLSPPTGSQTTDITPDLTWNPVIDAVSYEIQLDTDRKFGTPDQTLKAVGTTITPSSLPDGKYYWRVRGVNAFGVTGVWSGAWNVIVDTTGPDQPVLNSPKDLAGTRDTTPTLTWKRTGTATQYHIQVAEDAAFTQIEVEATVSGTTYTILAAEALTYGVHHWRVQAADALGNWGGWSTPFQFALSIMTSPTDGTATTSTRPTFAWVAVSGAGAYHFEVADNPDFNTPVETYTGLNRSYRPVTPLAAGLYYWHVQVNTGTGFGDWMPAWTLVITPAKPGKPVLSSPVNKALLADNTPTFEWLATTNGSTSQIQIDNNQDFSSPEQDVTVGVGLLSYMADELADAKYFWRVRAFNTDGAPGAWSAKWQFTIDTTAPPVPELLAPIEGAASTNRMLKLTWNKAEGASGYELRLDPDDTFSLPVISAGNKTTYTPPTPLSRGVYWWQVRALDKAGNASEWSEAWSFEIVAGVTAPLIETPTPVPTSEPTAEPTIEPTVEPTAEPTVEPTVEPIIITPDPTVEPTVEPPANPLPTIIPPVSETFETKAGWQVKGVWKFGKKAGVEGGGYFADSTRRGVTSVLIAPVLIDLTNAPTPTLHFWQQMGLSSGDLAAVDVSSDGGQTWQPLDRQRGHNAQWGERTVDLAAYRGQVIRLRFRLDTQGRVPQGERSRGWWIDEITVQDAP